MKTVFPKHMEIISRPRLDGEIKHALIAHGVNRLRMISHPFQIIIEERAGRQTYLCTDGHDVFTSEIPRWMPERICRHIIEFVKKNGLEGTEPNYDK